jgi:hypothetical protein
VGSDNKKRVIRFFTGNVFSTFSKYFATELPQHSENTGLFFAGTNGFRGAAHTAKGSAKPTFSGIVLASKLLSGAQLVGSAREAGPCSELHSAMGMSDVVTVPKSASL